MTTSMGLNLLRLTPVLSSTANLMYAHDENLFLSSWVQPSYRERANSLLPSWFSHWCPRALLVILVGFPASMVSGISSVSIKSWPLQENGAHKWYWAGIAFTFAHFIYGPRALRLLDDIQEDRPKGNSTTSMEKWLKMHRMRTFTADIPAWVCFLVGFLKALE